MFSILNTKEEKRKNFFEPLTVRGKIPDALKTPDSTFVRRLSEIKKPSFYFKKFLKFHKTI